MNSVSLKRVFLLYITGRFFGESRSCLENSESIWRRKWAFR